MTFKYLGKNTFPSPLLDPTSLPGSLHFKHLASPPTLPSLHFFPDTSPPLLLPYYIQSLQRGKEDHMMSESVLSGFSLPLLVSCSSFYCSFLLMLFYAPSSMGCSPFRAVPALPWSSSYSSNLVVPSSALFPPHPVFSAPS